MSTLLPEMEWELEDYLRLFRLHRGLILGTAILCGVFTAVQMSTQPNIYRATTRILIEAQTPQVTQFRELTPYVGASLQAFLQTEYQIITNPAVLERVISDLNLAAGPPFSMAEDPVAKLRGMITVELVRNTKLVDISAISTKRDLAARIANAVADTYARLNLERRQEMVTGGAEWLRDEVGKMEEKMKISQLALQAFREKHSNVDLGEEQQNTVIQRLRELTTVVTEAKKLRIEAETKYRQKHPALLELQAKEQELQQALSEQEQKALELNRLSIEYNTLLRDSKTSESIYNALLTRLKELSVQEGIQSNNVQVVSRAKTPKDPIGPNRRRAFFFSVLFGLFLGSV
ncbi:MAG: hypothetical protein HYZ90_05815, partial [Candidatus Omnitrophica bacterium]|nr:hypothetical protein [Candidatus Omnitrophota bacterium]